MPEEDEDGRLLRDWAGTLSDREVSMTITFFDDVFFIAAHTVGGFQTRFANEAYVGPIVISPAPTALDQAIAGSLGHVRFTARNPDGFTSRCFYHHDVTNNNNFGVLFKFHALSD